LDQVTQCRQAFNEADTNKDGFLSRSELCQICGWQESDKEVRAYLCLRQADGGRDETKEDEPPLPWASWTNAPYLPLL